MSRVLIDTGPIVAILNARDIHHRWAASEFQRMAVPLLSCDAVLSEAFFLLQRTKRGIAGLITLLDRRVIVSDFSFNEHCEPTLKLLNRYRNLPMSLADACLVRMAEISEGARIFTTDKDFKIYRKSNRNVIPRISPN